MCVQGGRSHETLPTVRITRSLPRQLPAVRQKGVIMAKFRKNQVAATDKEIAKNNRLALFMEINQQRQLKKTINNVKNAASSDGGGKKIGGKKMGKPTGTCEQCGKQNARVIKHFEKMACASCVAMRGFVKAKPQFVLDALREFHGQEQLPSPGEVGDKVAEIKKELVAALDVSEERQRVCNQLCDCMYEILEQSGVTVVPPNTLSGEDLCEILKQQVGVLRERLQSMVNVYETEKECFDDLEKLADYCGVGCDRLWQYVKGLERAYGIEHERCVEMDNEPAAGKGYFRRELEYLETIYQIMDVVNPGVSVDDQAFDGYMALLPGQVRDLHTAQESNAEKAAILDKVRVYLNLDAAVPDDQIITTIKKVCAAPAPMSAKDSADQAMLELIADHLGQQPTEVNSLFDGVANLAMSLEHSQQNCRDLSEANSQQRQQINELTRQLTTASLVNQVEVACDPDKQSGNNCDTERLNLCLAIMRGDLGTAADIVDMER